MSAVLAILLGLVALALMLRPLIAERRSSAFRRTMAFVRCRVRRQGVAGAWRLAPHRTHRRAGVVAALPLVLALCGPGGGDTWDPYDERPPTLSERPPVLPMASEACREGNGKVVWQWHGADPPPWSWFCVWGPDAGRSWPTQDDVNRCVRTMIGRYPHMDDNLDRLTQMIRWCGSTNNPPLRLPYA